MILYIITWTFIYLILIFLLHNLYLFFQDNLTTTKNKDYYNNVLIENISNNEANVETASIENTSIETTSIETTNPNEISPNEITTNLNNDFNNQMKNELNDFISKM
jgi:hypothetical protein